MSIPKIIHYCWFGNTKMPEIVLKCIESWKYYLPDYKFVLWNETNAVLDNAFIKECYRLRKWAFVSDYIRLKALDEYGGIYLDTDMLLFKNLDVFLDNSSFFGAETNNHLSCGIIGSEPGNLFIKACLELYKTVEKPLNGKWYTISIPILITRLFRERFNFKGDFDSELLFNNVKVYPKAYFYAVPNLKRKVCDKDIQNYITKDSYAIHLWQSSWMQPSEFNLINSHDYFKALGKITNSIFLEKKGSLVYYKKIISSFWQSIKKKTKDT